MHNFSKPKDIDLACPDYRGAAYPAFDEKKVNESRFEDGLRAKWWDMCITSSTTGDVTWESQEDDDPTETWEAEIKRAFKANGLKNGSTIHVKFGSRDSGFIHNYVLTI